MKDIPVDQVKYCNGCRTTQSVTMFAVRNGRPSGRQSRCKNCHRAYNVGRREYRKVWHKIYSQQEYVKEAARLKQRKYAQNNRDKIDRRQRLRRRKHPEYDAQWREENRERLRISNRQWARAHAAQQSRRLRRDNLAMTDVYIKKLLTGHCSLLVEDIPPSLIELNIKLYPKQR